MDETKPQLHQPRYLDGAKLKLRRNLAALSQAELAREAETSRGQVSHHESGDWGCTMPLIRRYAAALDCAPTDLMLGELTSKVPGITVCRDCGYQFTAPGHKATCRDKPVAARDAADLIDNAA